MRKLVSELFDDIQNSDDKIATALHAIKDNPSVYDMLQLCYEPELQFDLPPSYPDDFVLDTTTPIGLSITELLRERKKLEIFRKSGKYANLDKKRRETLFLMFLECLHYSEAEVLVYAKDHALTEVYPELTKEFYDQLNENL